MVFVQQILFVQQPHSQCGWCLLAAGIRHSLASRLYRQSSCSSFCNFSSFSVVVVEKFQVLYTETWSIDALRTPITSPILVALERFDMHSTPEISVFLLYMSWSCGLLRGRFHIASSLKCPPPRQQHPHPAPPLVQHRHPKNPQSPAPLA